MIPLELKLSGVRAFENHVVNLGGADIREVIMFGPNGSGKSTIARMIQALMGDAPDELQMAFLDERNPKINRRATAELTVLNPRGAEMWNPEWPAKVVLGLDFGYENNRSFSRYYIVPEGKPRQTYRTHQEYAAVFRRPPFNIKPDDGFMFIQQGESAALVQMRPRNRYQTVKQFLGLEDLEKKWQETLDAKERAAKELREAAAKHADLEEGLRRKEMAASRLRQYLELEAELAKLDQDIAEDDLLRLVLKTQRVKQEERRLQRDLESETTKQESLRKEEREATAEVGRLEFEADAAGQELAKTQIVHSKANEARNVARKQVEDLESAVGSLERVASEGLSLEALQQRALAIEEIIRDLTRRLDESEENRRSLSQELGRVRDKVSVAQHRLKSLRENVAAAKQTLAKVGSSQDIAPRLAMSESSLQKAREAEYSAQGHCRQARLELRELEENHTALPASSVAARDGYLARGAKAAILGDMVTPREDLSVDEVRAVEAALGELRWAVLVDDGRILVDYQEYTLADFARQGDSRPIEGTPGAGLTTCLEKLDFAPGVSDIFEAIPDKVLSRVVLVEDHEAAVRLSQEGFIAYTPDGYRYDETGRKHSEPGGLCLGQRAYQAALEQAKVTFVLAQQAERDAADSRQRVEREVVGLRESLRQAREAEGAISESEKNIPEALAEVQSLDDESERLAKAVDAEASSITNLRVEQALRKKDKEEVDQKLERVRQIEQLPALKEQLTACKERENTARRAAETALDEVRRLDDIAQTSKRKASGLRLTIQLAGERLQDLVPRIQQLSRDLDERRRDARDLQISVGEATDRWRDAFNRPEVSDEEAFVLGLGLAESQEPASSVLRTEWTQRVVEIRPLVEGLKDEVIPTAEEDYVSAKAEFDKAEEQLRKVDTAFKDASGKESEAQINFRKVMQETFGRLSSRFERYLKRFGWEGYLRVEPILGTEFELQIYLSVYEGIEPRPVHRNRSGGETSAVAALLTLAMVKEHRRPFYVFDEIDQSLDPANVTRLAAVLREELDRKYIVISHRLNKTHLEQGQFGIGVYRSLEEGSRTRVYQRKDWASAPNN